MIKKISVNVMVFGGLNAARSIIPLLMLPILTSHLTTDEFGTLALIDTTILFLVPLIMVGISSSFSINYHRLNTVDYSNYVSNGFAIALISFIGLGILSLVFKNQLDSLIGLKGNFIYFLTLFAFLRVCSAATLAVLQTTQMLKKYASLIVLQSLLDVAISAVLLVGLSEGIWGRLIGVYSAFAISSLIGVLYLKNMSYIAKVNFKYSSDIVRFGLPLIPHAIAGSVMAMADRFFISHFLGNEYVGGYVVAYQMAGLMLLFGTSVNQGWTPIYFNMMKYGQNIKIQQAKIALSALMLIVGIAVYYSKDLLFYLFVSEKFWFAKELFPFMLLGFIFQSLYFVYANYFFYIKETRIIAVFTVFGALINLILNYIFVKSYGVMGVAYVNAITWGVFFILVFTASIIMSRKVRYV
ncbi:lipopolysaccharide biosynthesis protein [Aeromonas media]|uniref:lipopolysaccharide biosynthesis protein n=1 Tax=Aeromonas media TaxID=651 RepID=UPI003CFF3FD2